MEIPNKARNDLFFENELLNEYLPNFESKHHVNYRCDLFKKDHDKKHIVFMGDSCTAGDGLEIRDTWAYKVYDKIKRNEDVSGYFNIAFSGASSIECILNFFRYCSKYSIPDVVFFLNTEIVRDTKYIHKNKLNFFTQSIYFIFEQYCKSHNIKLYTFSWVDSTYNKFLKMDPKLDREKFEGMYQHENVLNDFSSFYSYDYDKMIKIIYEKDKINKNTDRSLIALDGKHPGISFHDFYSDFIYEKYRESL